MRKKTLLVLTTVFAASGCVATKTADRNPEVLAETPISSVRPPARPPTPRGEPASVVPGQVLIKPKPGVDLQKLLRLPAEGEAVAASAGSPKLVLVASGTFLFKARGQGEGAVMAAAVNTTDETLRMVEKVKSLPDIEWAEPNYILKRQGGPEPGQPTPAFLPINAQMSEANARVAVAGSSPKKASKVKTPVNDEHFANEWGLFDSKQVPGASGVVQMWAQPKGKHKVVVGVVDTGIVRNHPDIDYSRIVSEFDMISAFETANDGGGPDNDATDPGDACSVMDSDSWHGTHVAGIVGAAIPNNGKGIVGVNPDVRIVPVRALGKCGGTMADIANAIRWAAGLPVGGLTAQQLNPHPAKVINLSLGGRSPCSNTMQEAIDDVIRQGATIVVAAGNDAIRAADFQPANCRGVITVAAGDWNGRLVTRYSNFGNSVTIMAPGGDLSGSMGTRGGILSTVKDGYAYYNGTSMAAPHVTGVVSLMLAHQPTLKPDEVKAMLVSRAAPRTTNDCPTGCGAGLLRASLP